MPFLASFGVLSAAFLSVAALERIPALQFRPAPLFRRYLGTDALWYLVAGAASAMSALVFQPVLSQLAIAGAASRVTELPWLVQLFAAAVIYDFVAFAVHVMIHRSDALWNVHKVHHSSQHLDWLATTRTHMFELFVRNIPAQAVLFTLGFSARTVAAAIGVYATFAVLGHSNLRLDLAAVEPLFVTPRLHRRHHVPATTQNNFGTIFSIWDRMFKLLVRIDTAIDEPLGVPGERSTYPQRFHHAVREPLRQNLARRAAARSTREPETKKWVTRARPKTDRIACPWLIQRFIDPGAEILYVPDDQVLDVAQSEQAHSFDAPGAEYHHRAGRCTFEVLIEDYNLGSNAPLARLARIVHAADIDDELHTDPAAPGLLAIGLGGLDVEANDHQLLERASFVYDALYAWCTHQVATQHA